MKKEKIFKTAANVLLVLMFVSCLLFVVLLVASQIIWTPGTPSPMAQYLLAGGAACLPLAFLFCMLSSILQERADDLEHARRRAHLIK
jgi:hypothetical protein